jgi:ADP-heptose:LPS heptosyltransferase
VTTATPYASPLRGRYLVHNRLWNAHLRLTDRLLRAVVRPERPDVRDPRRVLLAVGGHLGDAVIATSAITLLRRAIPAVEIGIVLGSWARTAVEGHPELRWIHSVDHWKINRSGASLPRRWLHDRKSRRRALREIRAVGYDVAVDLYMYYPNMAGLLWRAGIPVRIGYTSGGYGPLYTHPVDWSDGERHTVEQQASLLRVLAPVLTDAVAAPYRVPEVPPAARNRAEAILRDAGIASGTYLVVHMASGSALREWPREKWRQLSERLTANGQHLVFTGSGDAQWTAAEHVTRSLSHCTNLCGQLGWHEFVHVVKSAELVVCVETVAAHIAAAVGTPCVALWTGIARLSHWRPLDADTVVLSNPVPCAPCFRSRGCASMSCIRDLTVDTVLEAVRSRVDRLTPSAVPS